MAQTDLEPLTIPDPLARLSTQIADTNRAVTDLHPLLDLLQKPLSETETGLIERLFDLIEETREELRASRETRVRHSEEMAEMRRQIAEMHALLLTPLEE